jgi:hypothetical protein
VDVSVGIGVTFDSEPMTEHLEHEQDSPKLNVWCVLTHERVISQFFFDENIITSNSFLDTLEGCALLQLNNASVHPAYIVHEWCEFHMSVDWKRRNNYMTLLFS